MSDGTQRGLERIGERRSPLGAITSASDGTETGRPSRPKAGLTVLRLETLTSAAPQTRRYQQQNLEVDLPEDAAQVARVEFALTERQRVGRRGRGGPPERGLQGLATEGMGKTDQEGVAGPN